MSLNLACSENMKIWVSSVMFSKTDKNTNLVTFLCSRGNTKQEWQNGVKGEKAMVFSASLLSQSLVYIFQIDIYIQKIIITRTLIQQNQSIAHMLPTLLTLWIVYNPAIFYDNIQCQGTPVVYNNEKIGLQKVSR